MASRKAPRNKFEQAIWDQLKKAKIKFSYESMRIPYTINATYHPDFILPNGVILETKGFLRPEDRRKMASVKKANPELDIRIVFQKASPAYQRWAEKLGFPWCEKVVPKEWLCK